MMKYQANTFTLQCLDQWQDKTVYTFAGPTTDGLPHHITITIGENVPFTSVREFAEWQIAATEQGLQGCQLLKKANITLANGTPAFQAIFVWVPTDGLRVYQDQIFVLSEGSAFTLTASFSNNSRKTLGPQVERMMLSFEPVKGKPKSQGAPR